MRGNGQQTRQLSSPPGRERPRSIGDEGQSVRELFSELATNSASLVRDEIELAQQEIRENLTALRAGTLAVAIGAVVGFIGLLALTTAAIAALGHVMDVGLAALLIGIALAVIAGCAGMVGAQRLKRARLWPKQTIESLEEDKEWLKQLT